ncbi:MAG: hypothetical protein P4L51_07100 [Puia sp.]|nr:hypothetical protein [Puia sp.]
MKKYLLSIALVVAFSGLAVASTTHAPLVHGHHHHGHHHHR